MRLKISQVAIYVPNISVITNNLLAFFEDHKNFYSDDLKMDGIISGKEITNLDLKLSFNHDIMEKCELEFINSKNIQHWHYKKIEKNGNAPFLSHLGMYCTEEEFLEISNGVMSSFNILQDTNSRDHSNKREGDGEFSSRKYQDIIYDSEEFFGFNLKLTRKI